MSGGLLALLPRYRIQRQEDGDYVGFSLESDPAGPLCKWKEIEQAQFFAALAADQQAAKGGEAAPSAATWTKDNRVDATSEWMAGWDACRVEYPAKGVEGLSDFLPLARWVANSAGHGINSGMRAQGEKLVKFITTHERSEQTSSGEACHGCTGLRTMLAQAESDLRAARLATPPPSSTAPEAALQLFREAKAWVASDSYDGIDARGRELLEAADAAAALALLTTPAQPAVQGEREAVAVVGERGSVSWRSERILAVGTTLYASATGNGGNDDAR